MKGFGILVASLVSLCTLAAFNSAVYADQNNLDYVWRICIGLGAVPAFITVYFRLTLAETPRYQLEEKIIKEFKPLALKFLKTKHCRI